ncbi:MAG: hypothetical protein ACRCYU_10645 [Nocardioides sp.]
MLDEFGPTSFATKARRASTRARRTLWVGLECIARPALAASPRGPPADVSPTHEPDPTSPREVGGPERSVRVRVARVAGCRAAGDDWRGFILPVTLGFTGVLLDVLTASNVRATAGPQGVTVHWGVLGWPRMHYRPGEIAEAHVVHVPWWLVTFGFWWTPWRTTCTTRSGPALRLVLTSGRIVTVTVPEPAAAVAALR